ncbi:hypothetical protein [Halosolutus gelatinilyticus]|uniref:hypothetical protein n=1 Tax=Halosolutus gelatinilyticus TaxID=2931975 RepID=UPI001FF1027D|nr:hypothetical protein [Halosolutus gelatinilyticus]
MSAEPDTTSAFDVRRPMGWSIGGALGGAVGAAAFGLFMWLVDPEILDAAIPALYGLKPTGVAGWTIHIAHGIVLGLVFGFLVTRKPVLGVLQADADTDALSGAGQWLRVTATGFVFGLAIWAILPVLVLPVWMEAIAAGSAAEFPTVAIDSLLGHLLFGTVLGLVFATVVDLDGRTVESVSED